MPRRLRFRAALAGLALAAAPVLGAAPLAGPARADPGPPPGTSSGPGQQTQLREAAPTERSTVSRRARREAARPADTTPLAVSIDQLTPSTLPDVGRVRVSGTVTNNDVVVWRTVNVYAFVSDQPMTSSAQLAAAADTPPEAVVGRRVTDKKDVIPELAPGQQASFSFSVPRRMLREESSGLQDGEAGVYWFGVHALGEGPEGRDETADGRARTFLPFVPAAQRERVQAAVVIPLRRQLVYDDDGSLDDPAGWAQTLSADGRLRSLVDFGASSGSRAVTWVVDPALVDAVRRLADGNPGRSLAPNLESDVDDGEDPTQTPTGSPSGTPGPGPSAAPVPGEAPDAPSPTADDPSASASATAPPEEADGPLDLDGLDPAVQEAAQAAQAWLDRLREAMRPEDQVLVLPYGDVDAAGAAEHDPQLLQRAVARATSSLAGLDVRATPVLCPPGGYLSLAAVREADPGTTILMTDAMFGSRPPAVAQTGGHDVVVTSAGAAEGGPGPDDRTGLTAMRQRLLSEAAVRLLRGRQDALTMVVPHDWRPAGGGSFFSGVDVPWLDLRPVETVRRSATPVPVEGDALRYPGWQREAELDQAGFDSAEALIRSGAALQNLLTLNNVVAGTVTDQALGTLSYSARTSPIANRASAEASRRWIDERLGQVSVTAPRAVTLSSTSGRFQATVVNGLDQPVTVALDAQSDGELGIEGPARVDVRAHGRYAVLLTARTDENGIHEVTLMVTDKRGNPLGASTDLTIRSAQVSNVIWLFVGTGAALLFGAIGVRLFRRIRDARRAATKPSGRQADEPAPEHREPAGVGSR